MQEKICWETMCLECRCQKINNNYYVSTGVSISRTFSTTQITVTLIHFEQFLNLSTSDILGQTMLCCRQLFCGLQAVQQDPWTLLIRCQWYYTSSVLTFKRVLRHCQVSLVSNCLRAIDLEVPFLNNDRNEQKISTIYKIILGVTLVTRCPLERN